MRIKKIVDNATVVILIFICQKGSVRHKDLSKLISSRGTLSLALNALLEEGLVARKVNTKVMPIQTRYAATDKGRKVAKKLQEIKEILEA